MQNYFNYFTEVEDRFTQKRGSLLLLSTLDWALIETWRDAGVPLEAVLRGIDSAFERYEQRKTKGRARRINGLAWCAQSVMEAAEQLREAATGLGSQPAPSAASGLESERIAAHLHACRAELQAAPAPEGARALCAETAARLTELVEPTSQSTVATEALEATLRTLEEKLLAMLLATTPEAELTALREESARAVAPFRSRMQALQLRQIQQQFLEKRLLERYGVPRLSLFYMRSDG